MADCETIINIVDKPPTYLVNIIDKSPVYLVNIVDPCGEIVPSDGLPYTLPFTLS